MSIGMPYVKMNYTYQTGNTYHLKDEQYGLLQRMYAVYADRECFPTDVAVIVKWLHRDARITKKVQDLLDEFFTNTGNTYQCEWLDKEISYYKERDFLKTSKGTSKGLLEDFSGTSMVKKPIESMGVQNNQNQNQNQNQNHNHNQSKNQQEGLVVAEDVVKEDLQDYQTKLKSIVEDIYKDVDNGKALTVKQQQLFNQYNRPAKQVAAAEVDCWVDQKFKTTTSAELQNILDLTRKDNRRVNEYNDAETEMYNRKIKGLNL